MSILRRIIAAIVPGSASSKGGVETFEVAQHQCRTCKTVYPTYEEAKQCAKLGEPPESIFEVGDIVTGGNNTYEILECILRPILNGPGKGHRWYVKATEVHIPTGHIRVVTRAQHSLLRQIR